MEEVKVKILPLKSQLWSSSTESFNNATSDKENPNPIAKDDITIVTINIPNTEIADPEKDAIVMQHTDRAETKNSKNVTSVAKPNTTKNKRNKTERIEKNRKNKDKKARKYTSKKLCDLKQQ